VPFSVFLFFVPLFFVVGRDGQAFGGKKTPHSHDFRHCPQHSAGEARTLYE